MLDLKTLTRRIALPLIVFLVWVPAASAWSWPVSGPVLQPFSYDESDPYAAGQHRGVDIGADAAGEAVLAPAAGTISFAGTVPTNGKSVTIETADGYSVTLTHLGSFLVAKGATVSEGDSIGAIGPSGTPELAGPYVHLGIRKTSDPNGYVDPLGLLPPATESSGDQSGGTQNGGTQSSGTQGSGNQGSGNQSGSSGAASTTAAIEPTGAGSATTSVATTPASSAFPGRAGASVHHHERARESRSDAQPPRTSQAPVSDVATPRRHLSRPASSSRRPVVETAAPFQPAGLDAGHEPGPSAEVLETERPSRQPAGTSLALLLNGTAALVAVGAALAAGRRRRSRSVTSPTATMQVLRFPEPAAEPATEHRRAA
ncbi:MAG TPA: peptidoglycan DD-metalloendopeptidase family protein [Gaiellaceae bacterium]